MFRWLKKIIVSNNFANRCPERLQIEATECGVVSLQMIMEYYGVIIPPEVLRDECQVSRDGSKASSLLKTARKYGFIALGYRVNDLDDITDYKMPAILFWEFNHFLVCLGKKDQSWVLNDPASGRRIVSREEMTRSFTGILLEIQPGPETKKQGHRESFIRSMSYLLSSCRAQIAMLVLIGLLLLPQTVIQPNMNSILLDHVFQEGRYDWLGPTFIFSILMLLLTLRLTLKQHHSLFQLDIRMDIMNSYRSLTKLFSLPLSFFQSRFSGELTSRVQCSSILASFFSFELITNILNFMSLFIFAALLIYFDAALGTFVVIFAVILALILLRFINAKKAISTKQAVENGKLFGRTVHGMEMIETLKASGMENEFFIYWGDMFKRLIKVQVKLRDSYEWLQLTQMVLNKIGLVVLASFGASRILLGTMSIGTFMAFQMVFACFIAPVTNLINMIEKFQAVRADANRLLDIMRYPAPAEEETSRKKQPELPVHRLAGRISIRNLVFGYNPSLPPVIDDLSLEIEPGERIAIVGLSGSGKSTVAKLLAGAYRPWSGEILFDGRPRESYTRQELRYSFAMVDQDISLFPGNIRDNIAMYDASLPFKFIRAAAEDALIHDTISARHGGYTHEVNPVGSNFSGGEKQRLEIARALAVNPSILLLDEATAALDPATEQKIDSNLRRRGLTEILIAHRLSTIRDADRIVVLDHGKIAECGTHAELLKLNGIYAQLVNL